MMPGLGPTADGLGKGDGLDDEGAHDCPGGRNFLVTLTYNVTDVCSHEEASEQFWQWLATTVDPVVTVSELPLGSGQGDPQEYDRNGRFDG